MRLACRRWGRASSNSVPMVAVIRLDLGDRGAGGGLVDDRLAVGERRDQRLGGEVVDQPREAARDLVDQRDRVI